MEWETGVPSEKKDPEPKDSMFALPDRTHWKLRKGPCSQIQGNPCSNLVE